MLTFTEVATNLLDSKWAHEVEKNNDEELQLLLSNFLEQLSALPAYAKLKSPIMRYDLKEEIIEVIAKKMLVLQCADEVDTALGKDFPLELKSLILEYSNLPALSRATYSDSQNGALSIKS